MNYHISRILLGPQFSQYRITGEQSANLQNLSKVNIFVGANNSGKSRFLRMIAGTEKLKIIPASEVDFSIAEKSRRDLESALRSAFKQFRVTEVDGLLEEFGRLGGMGFVEENSQWISQFRGFLNKIRGLQAMTSISLEPAVYGLADHGKLLNAIKSTAAAPISSLDQLTNNLQQVYSFKKIYVPMLRGLRDFPEFRHTSNQEHDPYQVRTIKDYFSSSFQPEIWTGLALYRQIQRLLLGNLDDREIIAEFQRFLGESFFDGARIALIPKLDQSVLDIKIGHEGERPVFSLGDGIQSLILLTFPLFVNRTKHVLLFCEEPELNMHPGMQRSFLKLLTTRFAGHQYFFTSHSNHLLDLVADFKDVAIYTFRKELQDSDKREREAVFHVENVSGEDRRSLELLGVRNSSVFLSNCTIWVEGITDRRYFKHFLELYQDCLQARDEELQRYREDFHYSFVEYAGSCITHWSFLDNEDDAITVEKLCGRLFLIADGDPETKWKEGRHEKLQQRLGNRYYRLACKEVENTLSKNILRKVLEAYGETEFNDFQESDYQGQPLGNFIQSTILKGAPTRKSGYADGKTIRGKVDFCDKAVVAMTKWEDLSDEEKQIAKKLYDFIVENNK